MGDSDEGEVLQVEAQICVAKIGFDDDDDDVDEETQPFNKSSTTFLFLL
jgi:hypothetical protein